MARCSTSTQHGPCHAHQPPRQWRSVSSPERCVNNALTSVRATSIGAWGGGNSTSGPASELAKSATSSAAMPCPEPACIEECDDLPRLSHKGFVELRRAQCSPLVGQEMRKL